MRSVLLAAGLLCAGLAWVAPVGATGLDLSQYRGKVVYLDFWASWCVPCRRSIPWMNAMQQRYRDQGLVVIGVNEDSDPAAAKQFLAAHPAAFKVVPDPDGKLAESYGLMGMPSSFIIGRDGQVVTRHIGFHTDSPKSYAAELRKLLESASPATGD